MSLYPLLSQNKAVVSKVIYCFRHCFVSSIGSIHNEVWNHVEFLPFSNTSLIFPRFYPQTVSKDFLGDRHFCFTIISENRRPVRTGRLVAGNRHSLLFSLFVMCVYISLQSCFVVATTKQAYRDELVVYLSFSSHNTYIALFLCIEHCFTKVKILHFNFIYIYIDR